MKPFTETLMRRAVIPIICRKVVTTFTVAFVILFAKPLLAQNQVMHVNGAPCVGVTQTFVFTGSCTLSSWGVSSGGVVVEQSTASKFIRVRWDSPTSTAYVSANYYGCSAPPYSGTSDSPYLNIRSSVTPSVSITANSGTSICQGNTATFTANPTNGGSSPSYSWLVNGSSVGVYTKTYSPSTLNNGDIVSVQMTTSEPCATTYSATASGVTMTITDRVPLSVTINGSTSLCGGKGGGFYAFVPNAGGATLTYSWYKNGSPVTDNIATGNVYSPSSSSTLYTGDKIRCDVSASGGPIIPLLIKAGANGAADMMLQVAMNYYFDDKVSSISEAFESVNWWQVGRSAAEGLIPWKTPGGRLGRHRHLQSGML